MEGTRGLEGARLLEGVTLLCGVGLLNGSKLSKKKVNSFKLHSYDGPSSSFSKSVENAHALIAHMYDMMSPIKSKLQWVQMSLVLWKSFLYSYAHNKGTNQTALMRILIRILVARCSDNLFIGLCMPNSKLRRAAETKQDVVV